MFTACAELICSAFVLRLACLLVVSCPDENFSGAIDSFRARSRTMTRAIWYHEVATVVDCCTLCDRTPNCEYWCAALRLSNGLFVCLRSFSAVRRNFSSTLQCSKHSSTRFGGKRKNFCGDFDSFDLICKSTLWVDRKTARLRDLTPRCVSPEKKRGHK